MVNITNHNIPNMQNATVHDDVGQGTQSTIHPSLHNHLKGVKGTMECLCM